MPSRNKRRFPKDKYVLFRAETWKWFSQILDSVPRIFVKYSSRFWSYQWEYSRQTFSNLQTSLIIVLKHVRAFLARNAVKPIFYAIFHADYPSETLFCTFLSFKSKQEKHINQFLPPKWSHAIHGHKPSFYVPVRAVRPRLSTSSDS